MTFLLPSGTKGLSEVQSKNKSLAASSLVVLRILTIFYMKLLKFSAKKVTVNRKKVK